MLIKFKIQDMVKPPSLKKLSEAKIHQRNNELYQQFRDVQVHTDRLLVSAASKDDSVEDLNRTPGELLLSSSYLQVGHGYQSKPVYGRNGMRSGSRSVLAPLHRKANAVVSFSKEEESSSPKVTSGEVELPVGTYEVEPGRYTYKKSKAGETYTFQSVGGERTSYRLSKGVLTIEQ